MLDSSQLSALLKTLGDPTRLRMLALLRERELAVGELAGALDVSQSRVSNHLRLLRDSGLLAERRSGNSTFLRISAERGGPLHAQVWAVLSERLHELREHRGDLLRLEALLEERERHASELIDHLAADWDKIGLDFATGQARQRAAACLLPRGLVVADLGCGTGWFARAFLGLVRKVICIDRSRAMLAQARKRIEAEHPGTEVEFRCGELDRLPLADGELDGLVAGMVLHHLGELQPAARELRRVLKPGAPAVVVELAPHGEEWMRAALGDRHLGLDASDVVGALERAGFVEASVEPVDDHYQPRRPQAPEAGARLSLYLVRAYAPGRPAPLPLQPLPRSP